MPIASEFIAMIADKLRLELKSAQDMLESIARVRIYEIEKFAYKTINYMKIGIEKWKISNQGNK